MSQSKKTKTLYMNGAHNIVPKDEATWEVIHEYDVDGKLTKEVWVDLKRKR